MVPFAGHDMPLHYPEGIIAEHLWTRAHAGLFDVSHMGQLLLSGSGVDAAVEALTPADVCGLAPGRMRYSMLLADNGGILDDVMLTRLPQGIGMVVNGATKHADIAHLRSRLPGSVQLTHLDDQALLALQGPEAEKVLARFAPAAANLPFMRGAAFTIAGIPAWISRSGYTGEDGFEISLPAEAAGRFATWLWCEPEVKPIGLGARDSLRLEAGLPLYGHDLHCDIDPVSAGLAFAVARSRRAEGGFPGAASILAHLAGDDGICRIGLAVHGRQPAREGAQIYAGDSLVGTVTSGGFGPSLGAPVAMGYVARSHAEPGTTLEIEVRGRRLTADIVALPFVPHLYHRQGAA
jgi:aminomethyltransferase